MSDRNTSLLIAIDAALTGEPEALNRCPPLERCFAEVIVSGALWPDEAAGSLGDGNSDGDGDGNGYGDGY